MVAHTIPATPEAGGKRIQSSRPAWAKISRPYLKTKYKQKEWGCNLSERAFALKSEALDSGLRIMKRGTWSAFGLFQALRSQCLLVLLGFHVTGVASLSPP